MEIVGAMKIEDIDVFMGTYIVVIRPTFGGDSFHRARLTLEKEVIERLSAYNETTVPLATSLEELEAIEDKLWKEETGESLW